MFRFQRAQISDFLEKKFPPFRFPWPPATEPTSVVAFLTYDLSKVSKQEKF